MRVGFVGWRGMVGSVLMQRMRACGDFDGLEAGFFSTSSPGAAGPPEATTLLLDARDPQALAAWPVLVSCQGGEFTKAIYPRLRAAGWDGIWIDAAGALRMADEACLVLDPVNGPAIEAALHAGTRTFVGANCTVSLMVMGLAGLLRSGLVEWVSTMSYQAASGAGARHLAELVAQMQAFGGLDVGASPLELSERAAQVLASPLLPTTQFGAPLAANVLPWIDRLVDDGQTREEWKGMAEANKLLGTTDLVVDGLCVRVGALRCHAQALTIKLTRDVPLDEVAALIGEAHDWVDLVENAEQATLTRLTPVAVAGSLRVPVGRLRKMKQGGDHVTCFTVGDQLLWGAAEPLRRMLGILRASA